MMLAPQDTAARIMALFDGNETSHGTHGEPEQEPNSVKWGIKKTAKTVKGPPTSELWQAHLDGKRPLGVVPIKDDEQGSCSFGSIDIDDYDVNISEVIKKIEGAKLPLLPCRSKSGGLHLFLFTSAPVRSAQMQAVLGSMAAALGFAGSEIFPKQTRLDVERGDQGNWMVMPYYGGTFGGKLREQCGIKRTGAEMTIGEFLSAAEKMRLDPGQFAALQRRKAPTAGPEPAEPFNDGPPCLQTLAATPQTNDRNLMLFNMAVYYKRKFPDSWKEKLEEANQKYCCPPLPSEEMTDLKKSTAKKVYQFKCKDQPICDVCNPQLCRTRKFGVGDGTETPVIDTLRKVSSGDPAEDPVWYVIVEGSNRKMEIRDIKQLTRYQMFTDQCAKQLNISFSPMRAGDWAAVLREAFTRMDEEQASPDTTREGQFLELLETFLTNRQKGKARIDLLRGVPWENEKSQRHEFRMRDLEKFVLRDMRDATRPDCEKWIRALGGGRVSEAPTTISGKGVRLWFVPSSALQGTPELSIPAMPPTEI